MSEDKKVQLPLYVPRSVGSDIDLLREKMAADLGVSNISRGDYVANLIKREKEMQDLESFGENV